MFISKKKYNELTNKLDSMHKLLGDVLQHTSTVIDNNQAILQECRDLIELNKKILNEFSDKYQKLFVYAYSTAAIVSGSRESDAIDYGATPSTGTEG